MATSASNPLEEHITCSVCLEIYSNPHALKCLHTYCYQCIQDVKQGNRVPCPDCRKYTAINDIQKDFKMQSLIDIHEKSKELKPKPFAEIVCDVCEESGKPVNSYCSNCDEHMCTDCAKAHRGSKASKGHRLIAFKELHKSKQDKLDEQITLLRAEQAGVDGQLTSNRELINSIRGAEVRQTAEVNKCRKTIKQQVDVHHDGLIEELHTINKPVLDTLEQQGQILTQAKQQLQDKVNFLSDISQSQDYSVLTDALNTLSEQIQHTLQQIRTGLPKLAAHVTSPVTVVRDEDWDPLKSTRLEVAGAALVTRQDAIRQTMIRTDLPKLAAHPKTPVVKGEDKDRRESTTQVAAGTALVTRQDAIPQTMMNKAIHQGYGLVKSVNIKYLPTKLCVYTDELWVGGWKNGVFVYDLDLQPIKNITHKQLTNVTSVLKTQTDTIVCDLETGLHCLNQQGDYIECINKGCFTDVGLYKNQLFVLNFTEHFVHTFTKTKNSWVKDRVLQLSHYNKGYVWDKLCATSGGLYISCINTDRVQCYSHTGQFVYQTGEYGKGGVGEFVCPTLSDVDSGGRRLLVCDFGNNRLQVLDTYTREWSEVIRLGWVETPKCAGLGDKHIWVGRYNKLVKYEVKGE